MLYLTIYKVLGNVIRPQLSNRLSDQGLLPLGPWHELTLNRGRRWRPLLTEPILKVALAHFNNVIKVDLEGPRPAASIREVRRDPDTIAATIAVCDLEDQISTETSLSEQALRQLMKEAFLLEIQRKRQMGEALLATRQQD